MKLFGGARLDHPMADPREAKRILEAVAGQDAFSAAEDFAHWLESVSEAKGFKPEARVQLLLAIDAAAQPQLRKLEREYLVSACVVLPPGTGAPARNLETARGAERQAQRQAQHHVFIPQGIVERGEDYEIARFRAMVREPWQAGGTPMRPKEELR